MIAASSFGRRVPVAALVATLSVAGLAVFAPSGNSSSSTWARVSTQTITASKFVRSDLAGDEFGNFIVSTGASLQRFGPTGVPDTAFNAKAADALNGMSVSDLATQPAGKTAVTGTRASSSAGNVVEIARITPDGSPDGAFGIAGRASVSLPNGTGSPPTHLHVDSLGRSLVAVSRGGASAQRVLIYRWLSTGVLDVTFGNGGLLTADFAAAESGADLGAVKTSWPDGAFLIDNGAGFTKYLSNGQVDTTFAQSGVLRPTLAIVAGETTPWKTTDDRPLALDDGRLIVVSLAYDTTAPTLGSRFTLTRYSAAGIRDDSFGNQGLVAPTVSPGGGQTDRALLLGGVQRVGSWISISGSTTTLGQGFALRVSTDGVLDQSFGLGGILTMDQGLGCDDHVATTTTLTCAAPVIFPIGSQSIRSFQSFCGTASGTALIGPVGASQCPSGVVSTPPAFVPKRILDTRIGGGTADGLLAGTGRIAGGLTLSVPVLGRAGVPTAGVGAVVLNVTAVDTQEAGYATLWPAGGPQPNTSNINFGTGATVANLVVVGAGPSGAITLFNSAGANDFLIDVQGWLPVQAVVPLVPSRILDTRVGGQTVDGVSSGEGAILAGGVRNFSLSGRAGIPTSGVAAVIASVTVVNPVGDGFASLWPTGSPQPNSSNVNFVSGRTVANLSIIPVGPGGTVSLFNSNGSANYIVDVFGWFPVGSVGTPNPVRLLDTRPGGSTGDSLHRPGAALGNGATYVLPVTGRAGVPASGVSFVFLNVTAVSPTGGGYASVWPTGAAQPSTSNLNFVSGQTVSNLVIASVGPGGEVSLFNSGGLTQYIVDIQGWM